MRRRRRFVHLVLSTGLLVLLSAPCFPASDGTVDHYQKISDMEGGFGALLDDGDGFGSPCVELGDLDNDGVMDVAVGAGGDDDGGTDRGAVYILFLNTDGTVKSRQKISDTEGGFAGSLDDSDGFPCSGDALGDLDGDGVTDLAVGALYDDDGGYNRGAVYILFLNMDGTVEADQKISDTEGGFTPLLEAWEYFGIAVAGLGDLDGDGVEDLAVGAAGDDDGGEDRGAVYVLFLNADGTVNSHQKISDTQGAFNAILDNGGSFGRSVETLRDLDGDGVIELAVGARNDDDGGMNRGAVYILSLKTDGTVRAFQKISNSEGGFDGALEDDDRFGDTLASLGRVDEDAVDDLAVGTYNDDDGGPNRGAVYVLFMNADGTVKGNQKISDTEGNFTALLDDSDEFGVSIAPLGDLNVDGRMDLIVGAADDDGGADRGAAYVLFLGHRLPGKGDVNLDGTINVIDAWMCLQICRNFLVGTAAQCDQADIDSDGTIGEDDALAIAEYIIGMRGSLP